MEWPEVSIMFITFQRPKLIRESIYAFLKHVQYPREKLKFHLSDDGSSGHYLDEIMQDFKYLCFSTTVSNRSGFGGNVNKGTQFCFNSGSKYVFRCEDDQIATKPIRLKTAVALMESTKDKFVPHNVDARRKIGLCRLDNLAAHWLKLELREADTEIGCVPYLRILPSSSSLNVFSNRPHIISNTFIPSYGQYPEGLKLGPTEEAYAHHIKNKMEKKDWIVALSDSIQPSWDHRGISQQWGIDDVGNG